MKLLTAPLLGLLLLGGCETSPRLGVSPQAKPQATPIEKAASAEADFRPKLTAASASAALPPGPTLDLRAYPWFADPAIHTSEPVDRLDGRFAPPAGYRRVELASDSFGAWLRGLPLARAGTAVVSYRGAVILEPQDEHLAAVAALDVGQADLQQCADSVIRLHAEWLWSQGRRDMSYQAAAGVELPFSRWASGERIVGHGTSVEWRKQGKAGDDHGTFRKYLDGVFAWANTGALARQAKAVPLEQARPGDFFVLPGSPGHAILILDMAEGPGGKRMVLLGQGYMPAQSFHVLQAQKGRVWFSLEPELGGIQTPFWPVPFPWSSLRRFA